MAACGGGSSNGEPLISGSVEGSYDGEEFTATFGFATIYMDGPLLGFGDGNVHCGSEDSPDPPSGHSVIVDLPSFDVGSYGSVFVELIDNTGGFDGTGSNTGSVTITTSADTLAGTLSFAFTDQDNKTYTAAGPFEVVRCP